MCIDALPVAVAYSPPIFNQKQAVFGGIDPVAWL
jgi:hypothetical protein